MTKISTTEAARVIRDAASNVRAKASWNYDHAESVAFNGIADAFEDLALRFESLGTPGEVAAAQPEPAPVVVPVPTPVSAPAPEGNGPDPKPYIGFSGVRYDLEHSTAASLYDGPVGFEPRDEYGPTQDER
jgi:hypothetical protein